MQDVLRPLENKAYVRFGGLAGGGELFGGGYSEGIWGNCSRGLFPSQVDPSTKYSEWILR